MTGFSVRGRDGSRVLAAIWLDLAPGSIVAVVGEKGAGRSTLLSALAGLVPVEGDLDPPAGASLALSPPPVPIGLAAGVYLRSLARARGLDPRRTAEALSAVGVSGADRVHRANAPRVELARALASDPRVLLLDDALDLPEEDFEIVRAVAARLAAEGRSIVITGERGDRAEAWSGVEVRWLRRGRLSGPGPAARAEHPLEPPAPAPRARRPLAAWTALELRLASRRPGLFLWAALLVAIALGALALRHRGSYGSESPGRDVHRVLESSAALVLALAGVHLGAGGFARDRRDLTRDLARLSVPDPGASWAARLLAGLVRTGSLLVLAGPLFLLGPGLGGVEWREAARSILLAAATGLVGTSLGAWCHAIFSSSTTATLLASLALLTGANVLVRSGAGPEAAVLLLPGAAVLLVAAGAVDRRRI